MGGAAERKVGEGISAATEVAKPQTFNGTSSKVSRFISFQVHRSMQAIYKNKVEGVVSRKTNPMNIIICSKWISRHLEEECYERVRNRRDRI